MSSWEPSMATAIPSAVSAYTKTAKQMLATIKVYSGILINRVSSGISPWMTAVSPAILFLAVSQVTTPELLTIATSPIKC